MKKLISLLISLTLVMSMAIPTFATESKSYSDCTTNDERIQYFQDTYGFTEVSPSNDTATKTVLDTTYSGFSLVGEGTSKKILKPFTKTLIFTIWASDEWGLQPASFGGNSRGEAGLMAAENAIVKNIVHEMMHAFNDGILKGNGGSNSILSINGSYTGYTNANQYVTSYAATNAFEDFADTTSIMIINGGDTPCTVTEDTILYKKYKACYDLLLEHLGEDSNAVKRSTAFLGIELPKE